MTQESKEPAAQESLLSFRANTRLLIGEGSISQLGATAQELSSKRALVVSDKGILAAGHTSTGVASLEAAGIKQLFSVNSLKILQRLRLMLELYLLSRFVQILSSGLVVEVPWTVRRVLTFFSAVAEK